MLPKGAVLIAVNLCRLHLKSEDSRKGSEVPSSEFSGSYSACRGASILSMERDLLLVSRIERFRVFCGPEVAGAQKVQWLIWSISAEAVFDDAWFVSNMAKQGQPMRKSICHFAQTHFVVSGGSPIFERRQRE